MVRSVDVARYMEVSKPSVCYAVGTLREDGFLTTDENHYIHLTDLGRDVAEKIYERPHMLLCQKTGNQNAGSYACRCGNGGSGQSPARLRHLCRHKIHAHGIEHRLCTALHNRCRHPQQGIRSFP